MTFRVGQKVVCVDISPMTHRKTKAPASDYLSVGAIYTIRWVGDAPFEADKHLGPYLKLAEIIRDDDKNPEYSDYPFIASRFRPIVERKTDITVFTEILRKATKPARTPAMSLHNRACD